MGRATGRKTCRRRIRYGTPEPATPRATGFLSDPPFAPLSHEKGQNVTHSFAGLGPGSCGKGRCCFKPQA